MSKKKEKMVENDLSNVNQTNRDEIGYYILILAGIVIMVSLWFAVWYGVKEHPQKPADNVRVSAVANDVLE